MRPIQNADGHVGLTARNYPIAYNTAISAGEVVKLVNGLVVASAAAAAAAILGIAAENHPGTADALNARANGTEILVYDNPALIFECPAPVIAAASGSATTIVPASGDVDANSADDSFNNSILVLISKAADSTNPDFSGKHLTVTDYAKTGTIITKASGGTPAAGDKYEVYPALGAAVGGIASLDSTTLSKLVVSTKGATKLKCIGHDFDRHMIRLMAVEHALGGEE